MAEEIQQVRVFKYVGPDKAHTWDDPGPEFSVEDVKAHLASYFPEIRNADARERALDDGRLEIEFVKRSGTKGKDHKMPGFHDRSQISPEAERLIRAAQFAVAHVAHGHGPDIDCADCASMVQMLRSGLARFGVTTELPAEEYDRECVCPACGHSRHDGRGCMAADRDGDLCACDHGVAYDREPAEGWSRAELAWHEGVDAQ